MWDIKKDHGFRTAKRVRQGEAVAKSCRWLLSTGERTSRTSFIESAVGSSYLQIEHLCNHCWQPVDRDFDGKGSE
jgi:hypothetical protein